MTRQARSSSAAPSRSLIGFALLLGALSAAAETEPASSEPADGVLIRVSDEDELIEADSVLFEVDESEGGGIDAACSACVAAELRVNGLTGDRVEVRFDGIPLVGGLPRLLHLTQLPDDVVASTTVQRGPGSVLTGMSGLGGSIDLRSVPRDERRLLVETELGDWGWRRLRAAATDRFGRVGALVLVQGALHDAHSSNGDAYNEVADYERFTYLGRLDFELTDRQTLTLGASFQGNDQLDGLGGVYRHTEAGPPRVSDWRYAPQDRFLNWRSFTARWRHESASGLSFTADGQYSRHGEQQWTFVSQIELDEGRKRLTYDLENELSHGRFTAEVPVGHAGLLTAGLGWSKQRLWVGQTYGQPYWVVDGLRSREIFAHYEGSLGARWSYGVGLRHDTMTVFGRTKALRGWGANQTHLEEVDPDLTYRHVSPRGELRFRPGPRWSLTGSLGRGVLPPRPSFAERCCSARYQRNRQLRPERAWSSQLQAEWRPTPSSQLTLTGFWTEASDYHEKIVYQATAHVPLYAVRALPEVRLRGVELGHDLRLAKGRVEIGWATVLVDAEVTDPYFHVDELTLEPVLADGEKIYLDEHGAELRYIPGLSGRATFKYSGRRGTTVDVEARYTGPVSHFRIEQLRLADTPWSIERSEAYWRVDARVERELGESGWSGYVGVDNLTDYVMPDLGDVETTHEWGPRTGRFVYLGARYRR